MDWWHGMLLLANHCGPSSSISDDGEAKANKLWASYSTILHWYISIRNIINYSQHNRKRSLEKDPTSIQARPVGNKSYFSYRPTSGIIIQSNSTSSLSWKSSKQSEQTQSIALSSSEAEYYALTPATKEIIWILEHYNEMFLTSFESFLLSPNHITTSALPLVKLVHIKTQLRRHFH